jgi:digalactosyldiacylglycerol synthase
VGRYRAPGVPWTEKFRHVVGICHTNYLVYSKSIQGGSMKAAFLFLMNQWMCRAYCHKVRPLALHHTPLALPETVMRLPRKCMRQASVAM